MYKNFAMEDNKPTTANEISASTTDSFPEARGGVPSGMEGMFSPLAPAFRPRSEMANHIQQEPRVADMAPSTSQLEEDMLSSYRPSADLLFEDTDQNHNSFFMASSSGSGPRAESVASNMWGEGSGRSLASVKHDEAIDTFDFLAKTITSASSYVSMLTRDQLAVMRAFRPSLLYEFLKEIARLRTERRHNRANPNECAFCKNNGENEECYSSHTLKDWRGRVVCPVLRAFRCPRCGATGDRAHTIKYCPDRVDHGLDRSNSFGRRRMEPSSFLFQRTQTPSSAPTTPSFTHSNIWNPFNNN